MNSFDAPNAHALSREATAAQMSISDEDWSEWDSTAADAVSQREWDLDDE